MNPLSITPIYDVLIAVLFLWLSWRVIKGRQGAGAGMGDGGDEQLARRIRAQANCAEYAPLGLILILLAELQGIGPLWLHGAGMLLLVGRGLHGVGMTFPYGRFMTRVPGMAITFAAYAFACSLNVAGLF
ncbi:MAG: glutathione metabolism protein [Rhodobacteraceae bacterium]|nr:glutathione metabolism protein [Paracoccaceae bacterium]